jgi:hypothetical protein
MKKISLSIHPLYICETNCRKNFSEQKADYLSDDSFNNHEIYDDIKTTHVIDEIYQISFGMKKIIKSFGINKLFHQLELPVLKKIHRMT